MDTHGPLKPGLPRWAVDSDDVVGDGGRLASDLRGVGDHLASVEEPLQLVPDREAIGERVVVIRDDGVAGQVRRVGRPPGLEDCEEDSLAVGRHREQATRAADVKPSGEWLGSGRMQGDSTVYG